jgi:hypothetical protein
VTQCGATDTDWVTQCGATDMDWVTSITSITSFSTVLAYFKLKRNFYLCIGGQEANIFDILKVFIP